MEFIMVVRRPFADLDWDARRRSASLSTRCVAMHRYRSKSMVPRAECLT